MSAQAFSQEMADSIVRQLVRIDFGARRCIIQMPIIYPSGSLVGIRVSGFSGDFTVSDMGAGYEEIRAVRATKSFLRHAPQVADSIGVEFDSKSFFVRAVGESQLVGAIMAVANASQTAVTLVSHKQIAQDAKDAEERLFIRLERIFGKVEHHKPFAGASGHQWDVDAVVHIGERVALFDAVSPFKQSIYATVAKYLDIGSLPNPPSRFSAVESAEKLGSMIGVLSQASTVVADDTPDETIVSFANAA
ncbi:MAG: hypothetical protein B7Z12_05235 [Caulobacter vibrioides]|uniref:DUF1828 domain-containing protein n=1 Tax=Caulobacter vibrioides TaxID=155892 RepID=A0A258DAV1_CAUVI|nr:MAG: hypothetical protein B7Z12_05235 [Caulobacter vibrioides]